MADYVSCFLTPNLEKCFEYKHSHTDSWLTSDHLLHLLGCSSSLESIFFPFPPAWAENLEHTNFCHELSDWPSANHITRLGDHHSNRLCKGVLSALCV